ncbi:MAG: hypothetical protein ACOH2N_04110 [Devosia sp.]
MTGELPFPVTSAPTGFHITDAAVLVRPDHDAFHPAQNAAGVPRAT